jgi:rubrerythrin
MGKKFLQMDLSKISDEKALAIAGYGESVAAYRYIVLSEKSRDAQLRNSFESLAAEERQQRERIQLLLAKLSPSASFYLSSEDKGSVCVGPRLVDARDDARFDEAMKLVIASEKRTASFYARYAQYARDPEVQTLFTELAAEGLRHVFRLRELFRQAGKEIVEPCPIPQLR